MDGLTEGDMDQEYISKSRNMFIGATAALLVAMALVLYHGRPNSLDRSRANSFVQK